MGVRRYVCSAAALATSLFATAARADYTVSFAQVGNNVVATGSGSFGEELLTASLGSGVPGGVILPAEFYILTGLTVPSEFAVELTGPAAFGNGEGISFASSGTGDVAGLLAGGVGSGILFLPTGYIAGTVLNDTSTYDNETFATLGLTAGNYVYDLSPGTLDPRGHRPLGPVTVDTFTVEIPAPVGVPEPYGLANVALGLVILGATRMTGPLSARLMARLRSVCSNSQRLRYILSAA